jgi:hypothetical protein
MSARNRIKTEHAGAKNGHSSYYGRRAEAKSVCKRMRRRIAKSEIRAVLCEVQQ